MSGQKVIVDDRIPRYKEQRRQKANRQFILLAILFFMVILVIIYMQSPLSRLGEIVIEHNRLADRERLLNQAGLTEGMSYFDFRIGEVEEKLEVLPEIKKATVKREFPNRLYIAVEEHDVVAFWSENGELFPVLSNGHILDKTWEGERVTNPILTDWPHQEGLVELSRELTKLSPVVTGQISEIVLTPTLSDPYRLTLYMVDGFEVRTSIRRFSEQMGWYPHIREELEESAQHEGIIYLLDGTWAERPVGEVTDETEEQTEGVEDEEEHRH
ncbi:Polypeptide-transport-associated domain protein FtsQ-type [Caldalkalibacillus thermarum TA2.A1]|uniref:Cell division protein DivIB n=1 Tax=Caldalkalibacillus thermarum (strain TA2.A1) TaxID=986075 RepID=F5L902_CALTT|nr:FtsQ-type POTRA domain-containing protein [Caldalkalibacillus thermarum]EGL82176.1 Polypeptide-transport-associated domain protein FtsQ-type [Caldalkalibacillus thermarum TA2.A1]QZT33110.1 FtsQ-type POTRA domain-containing protein [Caldalkalibacillus thermarum TA2.A1]